MKSAECAPGPLPRRPLLKHVEAICANSDEKKRKNKKNYPQNLVFGNVQCWVVGDGIVSKELTTKYVIHIIAVRSLVVVHTWLKRM